MKAEILIRNIKLQELGIGKLSIKEQQILDFLNDNLSNLNTYTSNRYTDSVFYGKSEGDIILEYDRIDRYLYVDSGILVLFLSRFNMVYFETQKYIGWKFKESEKLDILCTRYGGTISDSEIEGTLQLESNLNV